MKRTPKFPLEYEKAIRGPRGITRKRTTKEAEKAFDALCQDLYAAKIRQYYIAKFGRADEKRVQERVEGIKQHYREEGFDQVSFEQCRNHYNQMPRRRPRKSEENYLTLRK